MNFWLQEHTPSSCSTMSMDDGLDSQFSGSDFRPSAADENTTLLTTLSNDQHNTRRSKPTRENSNHVNKTGNILFSYFNCQIFLQSITHTASNVSS